MATIADYNLARVQVVLGNFRVTGFAADDAVTIAPVSDSVESDVGADGAHVTVSRINDPRRELTLKVRRGTAAWKNLSDAFTAQDAAAQVGAVPALGLTIYDPASGDKFVERNIRFMRRPDFGFSKSASDAEFKLLAPSPTETFGANIDTST